jgi:hypothetical protein
VEGKEKVETGQLKVGISKFLGMRAKSRERKLLSNGSSIPNNYIRYLCVITGNILFAVVPKLGQKNLIEINLKIIFNPSYKRQNFQIVIERKITMKEAERLLLQKHFSRHMLCQQLLTFKHNGIIYAQ